MKHCVQFYGNIKVADKVAMTSRNDFSQCFGLCFPNSILLALNALALIKRILAIGLARYDSDRGGAQEDDRTGGYRDCANEILSFAQEQNLNIKVIFVNDGPGLLLGSMWNDYAAIEESWPEKIMVLTLRMIPSRLTQEWLFS